MKRNLKRLPALLLAIILCLSLLPVTALAASFPSKFYASISLSSSSESFGTVSSNGTYTKTGTTKDRVICGMEYAGGVFFTVEGNFGRTTSQDGSTIMSDDGWRELRMYNSTLTSYRTIGEVNEKGGGYKIVDTAIDLSGEKPVLYGTYNFSPTAAISMICTIDLETAKTGNYLQVTGLEEDVIYAIAFDEDGTLYAVGADKSMEGGPASLYTIDLENAANSMVQAQKVEAITSQTGNAISTNFAQDMAFDYATDTLYWAENKKNEVYTIDTSTAVATYFGQVKYNNYAYALQSFCIPNDTAFDDGNQYMVSVICVGGGKVTNKNSGQDKVFYMVGKNGSLTLALTPDKKGKLLSVKVDGKSVSAESLTEYTFSDVTANHVIEVTFRDNLPVTQKDMTWFHYQGYPASFYTQHHAYKFYELPYTTDAPKEGYTQTLLDEKGQEIPNGTIILAGNYDVRITHEGTDKYNALDVVFEDALQLAKCPGTPGRPVVYGKVGCTQGDLTTTSALQDYYGSDGKLIDAAHDEIPVTLVWLSPETVYDEAGNFYASATIYAGELSERILACYNDDEGNELYEGKQISSRATQVVVLPADEASLIKVQASDDAGGTVSGKGVYKNGDSVTVTATVNENDGYEFKGWQENGQLVSGAGETYTFTANGDRTLTALFELSKEYTVRLTVDPTGAGTVTGGGSYDTGEHKATVTATANQGYYFIGWYGEDGEQVSTETSHEVTVPEAGITLTAKFGIDYLARAELAKANLESSLGTGVFEWSTLTEAVDAYERADDFVNGGELPEGVEDAEDRFNELTGYYSGVKKLDFSDLGLDNEDLKELYLFTGVTELNLSGNRGVTDLSNLNTMTKLETLDLSNTVITDLSGLSAPEKLKTLDLSSNTAITDLSGLSNLTNLETLDLSGCTSLTNLSGLSSLKNLETLNLSGCKGVSDLSALKGLITLETLDISDTGVTAFDTLVNENGKITLSSLTTLTAQNLTLTSISALAEFISEDSYLYIYVKSWDFTGSTLPPKEEHRTDVATIKTALGDKFLPPTIPENTYIISVSTETLDFGSVYPNYTQPAARTVTITNIGNQPVTLTLSNPDYYNLSGIPNTELEPDGEGIATFTVQPKPGLALGTYDETLTVIGSNGENHTAQATVELQFKVAQQPTGGGGGVATYAITVENAEHGKVTASPSRASSGTPVTITVTPDEGYELEKLTVTDARGSELELTDKGNGKYTFRMPASKVTVEAVFTEILPEPLPFIDVDEGAWYADAVRYVYEHDLMAGYGGDLFGPNDELSRAQFCQIIYNMEDQPTVTGSSAFTDVADGAWYANAVTWAAENGIVGGYGGGLFGPEDNITREQFAAILYRYAQAKGYGTTASFDLSAYGDVSDVSAWAISAMQWACGKDIINGTSPTTLAPQGTATRAQAATMLQRFCEQYSQNEG